MDGSWLVLVVGDAAGVDERTVSEPFAELIAPHLEAMWLLARRYAGGDAEDVVQEALEVAWRRRLTYDAARGSVRTWLLVLVADRCRKRHRSLRPATQLLDVAAHRPDDDLRIDVTAAVRLLSARQRLAVELHYVLDLGVADTAAVMRCSPGTVKSTLSDARKRLRSLLEVQG
jgi:RNA polymerase sigma-70 factor (ECF subfamily)